VSIVAAKKIYAATGYALLTAVDSRLVIERYLASNYRNLAISPPEELFDDGLESASRSNSNFFAENLG
jgi:hypothetical protein